MTTVVQPFVSRSTLTDGPDGLRISIGPQRSWAILFVLFWLCAWTVGGVAAGTALLHRFSWFLFFWMFGWACGEIAAGYAILYSIGGKQNILVNFDGLTIETEIFGLGWAKTYLVQQMGNLRFQPSTGMGKSRRSSGIAFDYGARTVLFAAGVDEPEATELISRIRQRCPVPDSAPQKSAIGFGDTR